ncbi:15138_t:CDS:2 [Racocetra fulgida]|uniref:15138_t:CDS:1 n=1 Tax=Racocetra fulgida TaxID=60492 RepID=A0A9N8ZP29_9GLOM|nr:15138_t:CDS:2 [Racocetra fulgida]
MANTLNKLIEKIINERNEVIKFDYDLFNNCEEFSRSPFGTVRKATWNNMTVVLKSLNINTNDIDGINANDIVVNETFIDAFVNETVNEDIQPSNSLRPKRQRNLSFLKKIFSSSDNIIKDAQTHKDDLTAGSSQSVLKKMFSSDNFTKDTQTHKVGVTVEFSQSDEKFSTIINAEHVKEILSWINPSSHDDYELKLILRGSDRKDGFKKSTFYNKCKDKDNTVIVLKVEKTGEILGGYNPLKWERIIGRKYKETDASFIFSLKINEQSSSKLSRVKNKDVAICCMEDFRPSFGYLDLYMSNKNEKVWGCSKANYEKEIKIGGEFLIEDYEVFQYSRIHQPNSNGDTSKNEAINEDPMIDEDNNDNKALGEDIPPLIRKGIISEFSGLLGFNINNIIGAGPYFKFYCTNFCDEAHSYFHLYKGFL